MSFIEQSLSRNERIENVFSLHWLAWFQPLTVYLISGVISVLLFSMFGEQVRLASLAILAIGFIGFVYEWLQLKFLEQAATNKRVVLKQGIIACLLYTSPSPRDS